MELQYSSGISYNVCVNGRGNKRQEKKRELENTLPNTKLKINALKESTVHHRYAERKHGSNKSAALSAVLACATPESQKFSCITFLSYHTTKIFSLETLLTYGT